MIPLVIYRALTFSPGARNTDGPSESILDETLILDGAGGGGGGGAGSRMETEEGARTAEPAAAAGEQRDSDAEEDADAGEEEAEEEEEPEQDEDDEEEEDEDGGCCWRQGGLVRTPCRPETNGRIWPLCFDVLSAELKDGM